jgi:NADPH:quinone reductase-like Zn-dependent oxidoreductase
MRAIIYDVYGDESVLKYSEDEPDPKVGPDTVLVRVRAAGLNPVDWKVTSGLRDGALEVYFPVIPGWDVAGVVEAVGPAVREYRPGDEVIGYVRKDHVHGGTYAELVAAPVRTLAHKPKNVGWAAAAGLPLAGLTAYQALSAVGVGPGDTVLIHAASGGVGSFGVQIAKVLGARVIGTASERNHDFLRELGAEPVAYGPGLADRVRQLAPDGVDAAVDFIGGDAVAVSDTLIGDKARIASITDASVLALGGSYVFVQPDHEGLTRLASWVDEGRLTVQVEKVLPLERAAEAYALSKTGRSRGKIVLTVAEPPA